MFTHFLSAAAGPELAKVLLRKRILGIAYETVEGVDGSYPLLKPMSQIAGRLSIQIGAYFLQSQHGGSGVLLGGIPGTMPGHVVVVGAMGTVYLSGQQALQQLGLTTKQASKLLEEISLLAVETMYEMTLTRRRLEHHGDRAGVG